MHGHRVAAAALVILACASAEATVAQGTGEAPLLEQSAGDCAESLQFTHVLTGEPLTQLQPDEEITSAVEEFHCSGENPYSGDEEAIAQGEDLFRLCASCHDVGGEGRIGPSLIDETVKYERVSNSHGEFEVIYGGAAGAMQPMGRHFTQDEILRIMAYIETLSEQ